MLRYLGQKLRNLFSKSLDPSSWEEVERLFYHADLGPILSESLTEQARHYIKKHPDAPQDEVLREIKKKLEREIPSLSISSATHHPHLILIVGVNGNGKTTSVAKLAHRYRQQGKKVLVGAADTFRAGAIDQLEQWTKRLDVDLVKGQPGADPAAVCFDAITAALHRQSDYILIDTAGRLHTKQDLMMQLEKMHRVCDKALPGSPHDTWLVLDATLGQNSMEQAKIFHQHTPLTGILLSKLDSSAKGGIALRLLMELRLPIRYVGTGESIDDLQPFHLDTFLNQLLDLPSA